jgi:hypothetical protein
MQRIFFVILAVLIVATAGVSGIDEFHCRNCLA